MKLLSLVVIKLQPGFFISPKIMVRISYSLSKPGTDFYEREVIKYTYVKLTFV